MKYDYSDIILKEIKMPVKDCTGVHVDLSDDVLGMLVGDLLDEGSDHAAGAAPGGEEVQKDGLVRGLDLGEIIFGYVNQRHKNNSFRDIEIVYGERPGGSLSLLYHKKLVSSIPWRK